MRVADKNRVFSVLKIIILFSALIVLSVVYVTPAFSCTFRTDSLARFDKNEFVFVGTVTGYTDPIPFPNREGSSDGKGGEPGDWFTARGVKVSLKSAINIPLDSKRHFEVFNYFHSSVCSPIGMTERHLAERFPVGVDVIVIGEKARILPTSSDFNELRLEVRPSSGLMFSLFNLQPDIIPGALSATNYLEWFQSGKTSGVFYALAKFELRKDLWRFENTKDSTKRREIAKRLVYYPGNFRQLDILTILRDAFGDGEELDELYLKALKHAGYSEKVIDFHLKCVRKQIKSKTYQSGKMRC